jgi:hypothetical protein
VEDTGGVSDDVGDDVSLFDVTEDVVCESETCD